MIIELDATSLNLASNLGYLEMAIASIRGNSELPRCSFTKHSIAHFTASTALCVSSSFTGHSNPFFIDCTASSNRF